MHCVLPLNARHFGAKRKAKWCKMQGKMVQNAGQNGAKRKAKCCKMRGKMHKYPHLRDKQKLLNVLKRRSKGAKHTTKTAILEANCW